MSPDASDAKIHYGWVIVATASLGLFSCFGLARYAYSAGSKDLRDFKDNRDESHRS